MVIYKCDLCLQEIEPETARVELSVSIPYAHYTLCGECGGPLVSFLDVQHMNLPRE